MIDQATLSQLRYSLEHYDSQTALANESVENANLIRIYRTQPFHVFKAEWDRVMKTRRAKLRRSK